MTPGTNLEECKSSKVTSTFGLLFRASRVPMLSELYAPDLAIILWVGIGAEEEARAKLDSNLDLNCVCQLYYTPLNTHALHGSNCGPPYLMSEGSEIWQKPPKLPLALAAMNFHINASYLISMLFSFSRYTRCFLMPIKLSRAHGNSFALFSCSQCRPLA